jgi:hypothetical protein
MINFITITNNGYYKFADSQIDNFKKDFLIKHDLHIYCTDDESYEYHSKKELPNNIKLYNMNTDIKGQHSYLQGRFKEMMRLKFPLIIDNIVKFETPIWFIDNDVLFFKDPEQYIDTDKDILFQADMGDYPSRYGWVCTGCFWINNTKNSIKLLNNIIELQGTVDRGEQEVLNDFCKSWPENSQVSNELKGNIIDFKDAKLDILSYYLFQNGYLAFKNTQFDKHDCVMIHFNHETDYNTKVNNLLKVKDYYGV